MCGKIGSSKENLEKLKRLIFSKLSLFSINLLQNIPRLPQNL
jgi:hypothetical protein